MKKFYATALVLFCFYNSNAGEKILQGAEAYSKIKGSELIRYKDEMKHPEYVRFVNGQGPSVNELPFWVAENFGWEQGLVLKEISSSEDQLGFAHIKFAQEFNGIIVEFATIKAHVRNGAVHSVNGYSIASVPAETHQLSENIALQNALGYINANRYKWQDSGEEAMLKSETGNPEATYFPKGEMVYLPEEISFSSGKVNPCWKFDIYAIEPLYRAEVYIDAVTGSLLFENNKIHHTDSLGTAETSFSGTRTITADFVSNGVFRLRESGRGNGIETYDMLNGTNHGSAVDLYDSNNVWPDTLRLEYATDAHWGSEVVYDYYQTRHGRNSIDDNGFTLRSYVHYGVNYSNAFWDGQRMTYGDGTSTTLPYTTLDIAGHEITHGLTNFTADLVYSNEPGALNESFSDIFGCAIEIFMKPSTTNNWLMGEERGSYIRSMSNPKLRQDPDTYNGTYWYVGTGDNGGVHTNSGVQNHWFYLLSQGGTGTNDNNDAFAVFGLGILKAEAITFRNLTIYLSASSDYEDSRFYSIQAALDLYGSCSPELASTVDAWHAVGLGDPYSPTVVSDFFASLTESCEIPANVTFTNLSNYNALTYFWEFGDNATSTQQHPFHAYTSAGTYTVKLTATGNTVCGSDVETKTGFIVVAPPADAVAADVVSCDSLPAKLTATASDSVYWYDNASSSTPVFKGNVFVTPPLYANTTYYAQNVKPALEMNTGAASYNIGSGGFYNGYQYLVFDVFEPLTIKSVKVYADGSKYRGIELRNSLGQQLLSKLVNIADGEQRIELDFDVVPGMDYQLGISTSTPADLYRNSDGPSYPYTIPGTISIKRSSATTDPYGYYYFFYDWIVVGEDCKGAKVPVNVTMDYSENCEPFYFGIDEGQNISDVRIYPNPSSGSFNVSFAMQEAGIATIRLVDLHGKMINLVPEELMESGLHEMNFDASQFASGLYILQVEVGHERFAQRLVIE